MQKLKQLFPRLGFWIVLIIFIGISFQPWSTSMNTTDTMTCVIATIIIIALTIWLVNLRTHHGKLFDHRLQLSPIQKIILLAATIFCIISYVLNDNIDDLIGIYHSSWHVTLIVTTVAVSAGFLEEYLTRGYLFNLCQRLLNHYHVTTCPLLIASLFNSLIFGSLHLMNFFLGGQDLTATLQQVFYATCMGLLFSAFRIATNTIYIGAILHFLLDWQLTITQSDAGASDWLGIVIIFLPMALLSMLFIMTVDQQVKKQHLHLIQQ